MGVTNPLAPISYTNKDFQTIYEELLDITKQLAKNWDPTISNESDPGVVLLKLNAIIADKNSYNIDKNVLENYPETFTQDFSARSQYNQLGYKMPWYNAATTDVTFSWIGEELELGQSLTIPKYTMITTSEEDIVFTITQDAVISKVTDTVKASAIQGIIQSLRLVGTEQITLANLDHLNRLYINDPYIAENGIFVTSFNDVQSDLWEMVENVATQEFGKRCFEFGIDPKTLSPYLQFPSYIKDIINDGLSVKYITTNGYAGNVASNTITKFYDEKPIDLYDDITGAILRQVPLTTDNFSIYNPNGTTDGRDYETIEEAYNSFKKVVDTFDTLVTLRDYNNAIYNSKIVSNGIVTDRTNDIQSTYRIIDKNKSNSLGVIDYIRKKSTEDKFFVKYEVNVEGSDPIPAPTDRTYYEYGDRGMMTTSQFIEGKSYYILNEIDVMDAFDLKLYLLKSGGLLNSINDYNDSFQIDVEEQTLTKLGLHLADNKSIQHDFVGIEENVPFMLQNVYPIRIKIVPTHKLTDAQITQISTNIQISLIKLLNSRACEFGNEPEYDKIYKTIMDSDDRIKVLILDDFKYVTYAIYYDKAATEFKYIPISDFTNATNIITGVGKDSINKNLNKLKTSISKVTLENEYLFIDVFDGHIYKYNKEADSLKLYSDRLFDIRNEVVAKNILAGVTPLFDVDSKFDNNVAMDIDNSLPSVVDKISTSLDIKPFGKEASYNPEQNVATYTLRDNENLRFYAPSFINDRSFSNYVKFEMQMANPLEKDRFVYADPTDSENLLKSKLPTNFYTKNEDGETYSVVKSSETYFNIKSTLPRMKLDTYYYADSRSETGYSQMPNNEAFMGNYTTVYPKSELTKDVIAESEYKTEFERNVFYTRSDATCGRYSYKLVDTLPTDWDTYNPADNKYFKKKSAAYGLVRLIDKYGDSETAPSIHEEQVVLPSFTEVQNFDPYKIEEGSGPYYYKVKNTNVYAYLSADTLDPYISNLRLEINYSIDWNKTVDETMPYNAVSKYIVYDDVRELQLAEKDIYDDAEELVPFMKPFYRKPDGTEQSAKQVPEDERVSAWQQFCQNIHDNDSALYIKDGDSYPIALAEIDEIGEDVCPHIALFKNVKVARTLDDNYSVYEMWTNQEIIPSSDDTERHIYKMDKPNSGTPISVNSDDYKIAWKYSYVWDDITLYNIDDVDAFESVRTTSTPYFVVKELHQDSSVMFAEMVYSDTFEGISSEYLYKVNDGVMAVPNSVYVCVLEDDTPQKPYFTSNISNVIPPFNPSNCYYKTIVAGRDTYNLQTTKPDNWDVTYSTYYYKYDGVLSGLQRNSIEYNMWKIGELELYNTEGDYTIPANTEYQLRDGDIITFWWRESDDKDAPYLYEKYTSADGTIIKPNFTLHASRKSSPIVDVSKLYKSGSIGYDVSANSVFSKVSSLYGENDLGGTKTIDIRKINHVKLDPIDKKYYYFITNEKSTIDNAEKFILTLLKTTSASGVVTYTKILGADEFFIYANRDKSMFEMVSEGTLIEYSSDNITEDDSIQLFVDVVDVEKIQYEGLSAFADKMQVIGTTMSIDVVEQQVYSLSSGDTVQIEMIDIKDDEYIEVYGTESDLNTILANKYVYKKVEGFTQASPVIDEYGDQSTPTFMEGIYYKKVDDAYTLVTISEISSTNDWDNLFWVGGVIGGVVNVYTKTSSAIFELIERFDSSHTYQYPIYYVDRKYPEFSTNFTTPVDNFNVLYSTSNNQSGYLPKLMVTDDKYLWNGIAYLNISMSNTSPQVIKSEASSDQSTQSVELKSGNDSIQIDNSVQDYYLQSSIQIDKLGGKYTDISYIDLTGERHSVDILPYKMNPSVFNVAEFEIFSDRVDLIIDPTNPKNTFIVGGLELAQNYKHILPVSIGDNIKVSFFDGDNIEMTQFNGGVDESAVESRENKTPAISLGKGNYLINLIPTNQKVTIKMVVERLSDASSKISLMNIFNYKQRRIFGGDVSEDRFGVKSYEYVPKYDGVDTDSILKKIFELDVNKVFDYTHIVTDGAILDPLEPESMFLQNHVYNKFTLPRAELSLISGNFSSIDVVNNR